MQTEPDPPISGEPIAPMRWVDHGDGGVSVSVDPRHDLIVQRRIKGQAMAMICVSLVILAIAVAVPLIVHLSRSASL